MCVKLGAVQEIWDHHNICLIVRVALEKKKRKKKISGAKAHGCCRSVLKHIEYKVFNVKLHLLSFVISTSERLYNIPDFPANQKTNFEFAST